VAPLGSATRAGDPEGGARDGKRRGWYLGPYAGGLVVG